MLQASALRFAFRAELESESSSCICDDAPTKASEVQDKHVASSAGQHGGGELPERSSPVSPATQSNERREQADKARDAVLVGLAMEMRIENKNLSAMEFEASASSSQLQPMHSFVDARLFTAEVRRSATARQLAEHFFLPETEIRRNWALSCDEDDSVGRQTAQRPCVARYVPKPLSAAFCAHAVDPEELRDALGICMAKSEPRSCGFSHSHCHSGLRISCQRKRVRKHMFGLFCTVRSRCGLSEADVGTARYVEFELPRSVCARGLCIGIGTDDLALDRMVGSNESSVGFFTTGDIVKENRWKRYSQGFGAGDIVGLRIEISSSRRVHRVDRTEGALFYRADARLFVNGEAVCNVSQEALGASSLEVQYGTKLYCYVSMHGERSFVRMRCCRAELQTAAAKIGGPSLTLCSDRIAH
mmetsp:Transcript_14797/g.39651  ORF Transcript_14797/g.39651 Transcript_14797/m.39651 type:complete len:417 (+) Transcript_14797:2954-4204(+)